MAFFVNTAEITGKKRVAWITFRTITVTLLSLLLPLSFLVIARISTINYLISIGDDDIISSTISNHFPYSLLFSSHHHHSNQPLIISINLLICLISVSSLLNALGPEIANNRHEKPATKPYLYASWALLFTLQFSVTLGIEGTIRAFGAEKYINVVLFLEREKKSALFSCRAVLFFLGLHETILLWGRRVVGPVVDDTLFGGAGGGGGWVERAAMGLSYGGLWWWRLRGEVEAMVAVPEIRMEAMMGVGVWDDFVGWLVYYLMVSVGMVRSIKGVHRWLAAAAMTSSVAAAAANRRRERRRDVLECCNRGNDDRV